MMNFSFQVFDRYHQNDVPPKATAFLFKNSWDDYGYRTTFVLVFTTASGKTHHAGRLKISKIGHKSGRVELPELFNRLDESYFSVGEDEDFYKEISGADGGHEILTALQDIVQRPEILARVRDEDSLRVSLLRSVPEKRVKGRFARILKGDIDPTSFSFTFMKDSLSTKEDSGLSFNVEARSNPRTNVHALIGRNGAGKTRLLGEIIETTIRSEESSHGSNSILFSSAENISEYADFSQVISVSFSPFDSSAPAKPEKDDRINFRYVGLKHRQQDGTIRLKNREELFEEFYQALNLCNNGHKRHRWLDTIEILERDPTFASYRLSELLNFIGRSHQKRKLLRRFDELSSGHQIVLILFTILISAVQEKTLILLDEPEAHLHPPLLSSLIRAVSELTERQNGIAIIATHSPIVLQEIPRSCVWIVRRNEDEVTVERPEIETFGESVGVLTHEVFGLEVLSTGFYEILNQAILDDPDQSYDDILEYFHGQLGMEGRAIVFQKTNS